MIRVNTQQKGRYSRAVLYVCIFCSLSSLYFAKNCFHVKCGRFFCLWICPWIWLYIFVVCVVLEIWVNVFWKNFGKVLEIFTWHPIRTLIKTMTTLCSPSQARSASSMSLSLTSSGVQSGDSIKQSFTFNVLYNKN